MPNIFLNLDYLTVLTSSLKQASIITSFEHCLYPRGRCLYISDKLMICALLQSGPSGKFEVYDSDILVLKIILVLVFIQFWVNNFYFSFSFSFEIILVSISVLVSVL